MRTKKIKQKPQDQLSKLKAQISGYKAVQASLVNAAQQWRDMFDNINDLICMTLKDGSIIRCNKSMQKYLDLPFSGILGKNVHDLLHPKAEPADKCPIHRVSVSKKREESSFTINSRRYLAIVDPLIDTSGKYSAIVHALVDITDRIWLSDQLKRTNEFLHNIIESSSSISIISTDRDHRIMYWNKGAQNIFGYKTEEVIGKPVDLLYSKDPAAYNKISAVRNEILTNREEINIEIQQRRKDGSNVWMNLTISPRLNNNDEVIGAIGIGEDITKRKTAEEEKKKLEELLLQTQKMEAVGKLAGGVAHDFNNLLTIIRGNIDLMMMEADKANPLLKDLKEISLATERAANLTRQLLIFSRKNQPVVSNFSNINRIAGEIAKMLERFIGENIKIEIELAPEIATVNLDEGNLEQVIINLIVNARDAMPEGGVIKIKTENINLEKEDCNALPGSYPGKFVHLCVQDSGIGMDKDTIGRIFEPFFTTKKPGQGTGLGLSVIYGIIKQNNGWVNVSSEIGKGSFFQIYLPAANVKEKKKIKNDILPQKLKGKAEQILVVEDEEMICNYANKVLSGNGYVVFCAKDGKEALEIFKKNKNNLKLVITDMVLPDISGLVLMEKLFSFKPDLKVVFTSGYIDDKSQWSTIQEKGYYFLQKPFGINELLVAVRKTLDKP